MTGFHTSRLTFLVLVLAIFLQGGVIPVTHAEEPGAQTKPKEVPTKETTAQSAPTAGKGFDQATVSAGMAAFERSCPNCHDPARALERTKDLGGLRSTVRRMAAKRDANIAASDIEPIAVYLASRNTTAAGTQAEKETAGAGAPSGATSSLSAFATLSPLWRGGNDHLQNSGFGPLAWVGANWQGKIFSARATLCITCHGVQEPGLISRVEPVEVAVRMDLSEFLEPHWHGMKGN